MTPADAAAPRTFGSRLSGALRLDATAYEDVERDAGAMAQALAVVVVSSLATGTGSVYPDAAGGVLTGTIFALVGWLAWSVLMYFIGTTVMRQAHTHADLGQLLRTTGFAASPGLFGIVGLMPGIGRLLMLAVSFWMAMAMLVAVRAALDFTSIWRALVVVFLGWLVYLTILFATAIAL